MKITAGLGSIDEYIPFVHAGADEFFCGCVPFWWSEQYGTAMALNRREVLHYGVQIGGLSELEILAEMVKEYRRPVHLTFNSLYYLPEQYSQLADLMEQCMEIGFHSFILADPALLVYLQERGISCEIHLSGELGEVNRKMAEGFRQFPVKRLIFHRKNTLEDMAGVIAHVRSLEKMSMLTTNGTESDIRMTEAASMQPMEFEAFVLNELCQFTGAFCNSLHCDEMGHLCRVPYWVGTVGEAKEPQLRQSSRLAEKRSVGAEQSMPDLEDYSVGAEQSMSDREDYSAGEEQSMPDVEHSRVDEKSMEDVDSVDKYLPGRSGCGLCALFQLQKVGITHLKLVGRGNFTDAMEYDIRALRQALDVLAESRTEEEYRAKMQETLFPAGCSGACYYRDGK